MKNSNKSTASLHKSIILGSIIIIIFGLFAVYNYVQRPKNQAQKEAYALAKKYAKVDQPDTFYWFNRKKTYFTVAGKNHSGQKVYVIIAKNGAKINIYEQKKGYTQAEITKLVQRLRHPKKITNIALGMYNNKPTWEVTYRNQSNKLCYDLIAFKTGKVLKTIQNI